MPPPRILTIGGSDSGGGAGIEADIKTITMLGGYALTAITAVTAQDTVSIQAIAPIPEALVERAIRMAFADIGVDAVKIGMLGSAAMVATVAATLAAMPRVPIVLDPVLASTSGTTLLDDDARTVLLRHLMPLSSLITPNRPEAALLSAQPVDTPDQAIEAGRILCTSGAQAVLIKGGHFDGPILIDRLITPDRVVPLPHQRISTRHTHGTGCTLASAIATMLGCGQEMAEAIISAQNILQKALLAAPGFGAGSGPMGHAQAHRPLHPPPIRMI